MAKLATHKNTNGLNSGATTLAERILVENIKTSSVFESLIPIKENDLESITQSMRQNGFDVLHPVCVWKEENVLIDGHTRLRAAMDAGLNEIYCYKKSFDSEDKAIEFAINEQLRRRNLDDAGKLLLIEKLDNLKKAGRPANETAGLDDKGKSSENLGKKLGVSARTVERGRAVLKNADDETLDKVKSGEMTINKAYKKVKLEQKDVDDIGFPDDSLDTDTDEDIPYAKKITHYQEIISMDEHSLAVYLQAAQKSELSISEWEEKLKGKI